MKRHQLVLLFPMVLLVFASCQNKGSSQLEDPALNNPGNPFTDQFSDDFGNVDPFEDSFDDSVSSGLSGADQTALSNLFSEFEDVNPQDEIDLDPELQARLDQILQQEAQGQDMSLQKMQLAGEVMASCTAKIADYAPRPGEPLQGSWSGRCSGGKYSTGVQFNVNGVYQKSFTKRRGASRIDSRNPGYGGSDFGGIGILGLGEVRLAVTGGTVKGKKHKEDKKARKDPNYQASKTIKGMIVAGQDGVGQLQAGPWKGVFTDVPQAGHGEIFREQLGEKLPACKGAVRMGQSRNPIPEKSIEGWKKAGQCFRKALILFSPIMDKLFKNIKDPQLKMLLQKRMLGL